MDANARLAKKSPEYLTGSGQVAATDRERGDLAGMGTLLGQSDSFIATAGFLALLAAGAFGPFHKSIVHKIKKSAREEIMRRNAI